MSAEVADTLTAIGTFFGGLGLLFIGLGVLWIGSLYDKKKTSKEKNRRK